MNVADITKKNLDAQRKRSMAYAEFVSRRFDATMNMLADLAAKMAGQLKSVMPKSLISMRDLGMDVEVRNILSQLHSQMLFEVRRGVLGEYKTAVKANKALERELFKEQEEMPENEAYFKRHEEAAVAYMKSLDKKGGITLSERLWKTCEQARDELECAVALAVGSGQSAKKTAQEIRMYLYNPDAMYRQFATKNGRVWKKQEEGEDGKKKYVDVDYSSIHPGRGVYRDARKNAMRVNRTETNRAFRSADSDRWSQADYILGIRIQPSKTTHAKATKGKGDICDKLAGDYPKDFKFTGWHPNCLCYATPIVMGAEEMREMFAVRRRGEEYVSPNMVRDMPPQYAGVVSRAKGSPWWTDENEEVSEEKARTWEEHRADAQRLGNDAEYKDVEFDEETGGVKGRHISHIESPEVRAKERKYFATDGHEGYTGKDLELLCQKVLFKNGYACVLLDEKGVGADGKTQTALDTMTNGMPMDIKSITQNGPNTIRNAIKEKSKQVGKYNKLNSGGSDSMIMYFHDINMFDSNAVWNTLKRESKGGGHIKKVICVLGDGRIIVYDTKKT